MFPSISVQFSGAAKLSHQLILRRNDLPLGQQDYLNMEAVLDAHGPDIQKLNSDTTFSYDAKPHEKKDTFKLSWSLKHMPSEDHNRSANEDCFTDEFQLDYQLGKPLAPESVFSKLVNYFIVTGQKLQPFGQDSSALPSHIKLHRRLVKHAISGNFKYYRQDFNLDGFEVLPAVQYLHDLQHVLKSQKSRWDILPKSVQVTIDAGTSGTRYGTPYSEKEANMTQSVAPKLVAVRDKLLAKHRQGMDLLNQDGKSYRYSGFQDEKMVFDDVYLQFKDRNGEDVKLLLGKMPTGLTHQGYTAKEQQEMLPLETIDAFYKACFENALQWVRVLKPEGWQTVSEPIGTKEI